MSILTIIRQRRHRRSRTRCSAQQRSQRVAFGFGFVISAALILAVLAAVLAYAGLTSGLPPVGQLSILLNPNDGLLLQPTRLYDRTGQHLLAVLAPGDATRIYALYNQMPQTLINATVALTQPDFWSSPGYVLGGWQDPDAHPTIAQHLVFDQLLGNQAASPLRAIHAGNPNNRHLRAAEGVGMVPEQHRLWSLRLRRRSCSAALLGEICHPDRPGRGCAAGRHQPGSRHQPHRRTPAD